MRRGDVWLVDPQPGADPDPGRARPAIIVSNDGASIAAGRTQHGVITVIPLSPNTSSIFAFQVLLDAEDTGLPHATKAQAELITSVSVTQMVRRVGTVPLSHLPGLNEALRLHLGM